MEHPDYRINLEQVLAFSEGRQLLTAAEVSKFTGLKDIRTVKRHFPFTKGRISAATLARCMCGGEQK